MIISKKGLFLSLHLWLFTDLLTDWRTYRMTDGHSGSQKQLRCLPRIFATVLWTICSCYTYFSGFCTVREMGFYHEGMIWFLFISFLLNSSQRLLETKFCNMFYILCNCINNWLKYIPFCLALRGIERTLLTFQPIKM